MHRLDDAILVVQSRALNRHAPDGLIFIPPAPHDVGIEAAVRMRQLDVPLAQAFGPPPAVVTTDGDPLLALAAEIPVVIDAVVGRAATGGDALIRGGDVEAFFGGVGAHGGFEGAEAEDAGDEGPEVGDVGDDDGGGGLAGVPV